MGIMNKMKTVALKDLTWTYNTSSYVAPYFAAILPNGVHTKNRYCEQYKMVDRLPATFIDKTMCDDRDASDRVYVEIKDLSFTDITTFVQYLTDNNITITYETIDSVEEKIVSYHAQQLVNGSLNELAAVVNGQHVIIPKANASCSQRVNRINVPVGHKVLNIERFLRGNAGSKTISFGGYHLGSINSWQGAFNLPFNTDLRGQTLSVIHTVTEAVTDTWMFVYDPTKTIAEEIECVWTFVDLTAIYGAGNEPTDVNTFLQQHPEYNQTVPFYEGPINIREEII